MPLDATSIPISSVSSISSISVPKAPAAEASIVPTGAASPVVVLAGLTETRSDTHLDALETIEICSFSCHSCPCNDGNTLIS